MDTTSISASIVAIPTFTDVDTTETFTRFTTSIGTRGHTATRTAIELITVATRVSTTIFSTLAPETARAATTTGVADTVTHSPPSALIGGIVAGVLFIILGLTFGLYRWRRQVQKKLARRRSSWRIEEGDITPSEPRDKSQITGMRQMTQARSSPVVPISPVNTSPPPLPRKVFIDRAAELERELEAARISLQISQNGGGGATSGYQSENDQTWKDEVKGLRDEVDRLHTALTAAGAALPPAYERGRESIVTQLLIKS